MCNLCSSLESLSRAPTCEILRVDRTRRFKPHEKLFYQITLKRTTDEVKGVASYEPEAEDLIAFTDNRPESKGDLEYYHIASVSGPRDKRSDKIPILSSKYMDMETERINKEQKLYAVYLLNMRTNVRMWNALNSQLQRANMNIIKEVLQADSTVDAVSSCVALRKCHHDSTVKLIWPLQVLAKQRQMRPCYFHCKVRTLTCAPTNIEVLEVAARLTIVKGPPGYHTYGIGNIVLFGNSSRMKVEGYQGLDDVFLDCHAEKLLQCFAPLTGWEHCLGSMISLLEDPQMQYRSYKLGENDREDNLMSLEEFSKVKNSIELIYRLCKQNEENDDTMTLDLERSVKEGFRSIEEQYNLYQRDNRNSVMTMEQFVKQRFSFIGEKLKFCMQTLLPTSFIPLDMFRALDLLKSLEKLLCQTNFTHVIHDYEVEQSTDNIFGRLSTKREGCLDRLRSLYKSFSKSPSLPNITNKYGIENFRSQNACLFFCTSSSSNRLYKQGMTPLKLLVIDEAAQLKNCESTIPLQLPGLHHAFLIGDERQLSAWVINILDLAVFMIWIVKLLMMYV